jgi:hypothetical protein
MFKHIVFSILVIYCKSAVESRPSNQQPLELNKIAEAKTPHQSIQWHMVSDDSNDEDEFEKPYSSEAYQQVVSNQDQNKQPSDDDKGRSLNPSTAATSAAVNSTSAFATQQQHSSSWQKYFQESQKRSDFYFINYFLISHDLLKRSRLVEHFTRQFHFLPLCQQKSLELFNAQTG